MSYLTERDDVFNSHVKSINMISSLSVMALLILGTIRLAARWSSITADIGIMFDPDGNISKYADKKYAAIPLVAALGVLLLCDLITGRMDNIIFRPRISVEGRDKILSAFAVLLDAVKLGFGIVFAGMWSDCIIRQVRLDVSLVRIIAVAVWFVAVVCVIYSAWCMFRYHVKKEKKD